VHVRHADAGSDGSEEWEIQALLGPVYDIGRLGVFFTASPRHADVLLVLGTLSALLGIAHAAVQNRLSRVIAYSSIENTGLIVTGFGVALTGAAIGDRRRPRPACSPRSWPLSPSSPRWPDAFILWSP